jgi:hypothetical protein
VNKIYVVFGVLVLLAIGIVLTNEPQLSPNEEEMSITQKTQEREKIVAQNLIKNHFEQKQFVLKDATNTQDRGLASEESSEIIEVVKKSLEGEVARDPWGHHLKYKVIGDGKPSTGSKIVILSSGPNEKIDTDLKSLNGDSVSSDDIATLVNY